MEQPDTRYRTLDVRPLLAAGREPFGAIRGAVNELGDGEGLHLIVSFEPVPLYRVLGRLGFAHHAEVGDDGAWHVRFHRPPQA